MSSPLRGLCFSFGLRPRVRSLLVITLCERGMFWLSGIVCVHVVGKRWITYCYIILWRLRCGIMSSTPLGLSGCYLVDSKGSFVRLVRETLFHCLKFSPFVLDVDILEGAKLAHF